MPPRQARRPLAPLTLAIPLALAAVPALLGAGPAQAAEQAQLQRYAIPAGPLAERLNQFAAQAGIYLAGDAALTAGRQSQPLEGSHTVEQALAILLGGSGLQAVPTRAGHYEVQPLAETGTSMALDAISVSEAAEDSSYRAAESAIGDKFETPFLEQTQTAYSVNRQVLDDFAVSDLEETIKFVPGITIGNSFGGTQDSLVKRGFGNGSDGGVLRDGIRTSEGRNYNSVTTERVEVLKGPASLLYGMQEPGGVINVVSKKPTYHWRSTLGGQLSSEGGGSGYFDVSGPLGESGFAFRLIGQHKDEDYWRNYGVNRDKLVAPSLAFESEAFSANLSYEYSDYTSVLDRGAFFYNGHAVGDREHRIDEHWTRIDGQRQYASLAMEYRFSPTSRLRFNYGWNENAYSDYQADPNAYDPATGELRRRFRSNPDVERTRNYASLDWLNELELGGLRHELSLGADHERHDESNGFFYQGPNTWGFDPDSPHYGDLKQVEVVNPSNSQQRSRVRMLSAYVKDNIHIGERWILSLGLRHQRFRQRDWAGIPTQIGTNLNKSKNLPFVGLVYKLDDEFSLYANYSESYKPNVIASGTLVESGSDPEEGRQYEIGLRYDNGWLSGLVALFDIRKENIQTTETINGEQVTRAVGEARSRGLEASLNGQLGERWNLVANYAYTDTEVLEDTPANEGNELLNVAHNVAGLFLSYDLPQSVLPGTFRLGGGARYVGSREGDMANSFELSGYTTYDAFVTWTLPNLIGKKTELQLNVDNLTDKEYFISSGGTSNRVSWGAARTATLSATVDF
ncbi:TonB-dependent siderophore receptor [Azotobacter chroococcum]|uniref:TonB-dependent siderophore receptor n=1 Tax=Azotobacter chroococcum TaxID=353 RepID=UPI000B5E25C5|nr:TonB-dependent receptor [Azotobacter chroococcum]ASL24881.1 TonB-dependent receptor [Azotobacter chroococcum]